MRTLITCLMILMGTAVWAVDVPVTVNRTDDGLSVTFQMPGIKARTVTADGIPFSRLAVKSAGHTGRVGAPELPVFAFPVRFDGMRLPKINDVTVQWETMGLAHPVYPIQQPWPKNRPLSDRPFSQDMDAYRDMDMPPVVGLGDPYIVRGINGIPVILRPVRFNPASGTLEIAASVTFDMELNHDDHASADVGAVFEQVLSKRFVDWDTREVLPETVSKAAKVAPAGRYLVICAPSLESGLASYVAHKEAMGYSVTLMTTDDTGTSSSAIKEAIQKEYDEVATRPDFVLLVGNDVAIPTFSGTGAPGGGDIPRTDLDYSLLDGSDFMPDVLLGRWPAATTDELANLVTKSMDMENRAAWMEKKVLYMASTDQSTVTETTHNYVDDVLLGPDGYEAVKLWHRLGTTTTDTTNAFNDGQKLAIYSGHGSNTSWADGPPFANYNVRALTNTDYPFVFSFACVTGAYVGRECFAETMVVDEHGGVTCVASSVNSYWGPDDTLEREMFGRYIDQGLDHIGAVVLAGKIGFYQTYAVTDWPAAYFDQYNLFGDPGLMVRGYAAPSSRCRIFLDVDEVRPRGSVTVHLWDSDLTASTAPVDVVHPITGAIEPWTLNRTDAGKYSRTFTVTELTDGLDYSAKVWFREATDSSKADPATAVLQVDGNGTTLTHVQMSSVLDTSAVMTIFLDEPATYLASLYQGATLLASVPGDTLTTTIQLTMTGLSPDTAYRIGLELTDGMGGTSYISTAGEFTTATGSILFADDCDTDTGQLTHYADDGADGWNHVPSSGIWYCQEMGAISDSSLEFGPVALPFGDSTLTFEHQFDLELDWDGAVLEYSTDGSNWDDLGSRMLTGGYNGTVHNDWGNPLPPAVPLGATREAWTGANGTMETVTVDLTDFAGGNLWVRFRMGADSSFAEDGWYVDNILVQTMVHGLEPLTFVHVNGDSQLYLAPLGDGSTAVTFRAYANDGTHMGDEVVSLDAMEQVLLSVSELFAPLDVSDIGSIRATAPDRIAGWVMDDFDDHRGAMRTFTPAFKGPGLSTALVPHVANQTGYWSTKVGFHNLNDTAVNPTFTYQQGACHSTELGLFPVAATGWFDVEMDIFGGAFPYGGMTYGNLVDAGSTTKLAAVESFEKKTIPNAAALTLDLESGNRLIVTHVSNKSFWWTGIALDNLSTSSTAAVQVTGYRTDGTLTESRMYGVRPGDKLLFVTKNEFSVDTAWFDIESDIPLIGYELFGTTNNQSLAGLGIPVRGSKDQVLPVMDLTGDWYGVTLVNPNDTETDVTITLYDDGAVLHTYTFTLAPRQKYVSLLENLFEGSAADYMDTDLVRIETNLPVTAFCLQGNLTQTRLGGVLAASTY